MPIASDETYFEGADGRRLFERLWRPQGPARASVVVVHGFAEHSGRYAWTAERLAARGYNVRAFDLRGHGNSDGRRTYVRSLGEHLRDLQVVLGRARAATPDAPIFILGHSMGGTTVIAGCAADPPDVRGVLVSGAVLPLENAGKTLAERIVLLLGRFVPRLPLVKLKASDVSRDPETVRLYDADPLNFRGRVRAGVAAAMVRATRRIEQDAPAIRLPILLMHGTADALANPEGSRRLAARISSDDRTLRMYEGLYHEILNEPERETVLADILAWLDARTVSSS